MKNCEAMTSSTHSLAYSYWLVKKCFLKICETWKCHNFLIFQLIFITFSLFSSIFFTLSSEIKLNLFRISPLICPSVSHHIWFKIQFLPDAVVTPLRKAALYEPRIANLGIWGDTWLTRGKYIASTWQYVVVTGPLQDLGDAFCLVKSAL